MKDTYRRSSGLWRYNDHRTGTNWRAFFLIGVAVFIIALAVHEFGHALTAYALGWDVTTLYLWGFSVLPEFRYVGFEGGYMGYTGWSVPVESFSALKNGLILIMGSGATLSTSAVAIFSLYFFTPISFFWRTTLFFLSLLYLDMVTYAFGLRFSGESEPLKAAREFGMNESVMLLFVIMVFFVFSGLVALYFYEHPPRLFQRHTK